VSKLRLKRFDIVISDLKLPDITGIDVLREAKQIDEHCIVLIMTAFASVDTAVDSLEKGAFEYFVKPLNFKHLDIVIHRALTYRDLQLRALEGPADDLCHIVGTSAKINHVRAQIRALAGSELTVLILGETGTGKEIVAQAIHDSSRRRNEPFIAVNCGALPESLLESELFGHVKARSPALWRIKAGCSRQQRAAPSFSMKSIRLQSAPRLLFFGFLISRSFDLLAAQLPDRSTRGFS